MSVNFFDEKYREPSRSDALFGICDNQNGTKAYTDIADENKWIAKVINNENINITFTPIDNCIIIFKENNNDKESTCDGMLTFSDSLYLVELKDKQHSEYEKAKEQIKNTVRLLCANHDITIFKYKKAFICNKKHPYFHVIENAEQKDFFNKTGFRLDIQSKIQIK